MYVCSMNLPSVAATSSSLDNKTSSHDKLESVWFNQSDCTMSSNTESSSVMSNWSNVQH